MEGRAAVVLSLAAALVSLAVAAAAQTPHGASTPVPGLDVAVDTDCYDVADDVVSYLGPRLPETVVVQPTPVDAGAGTVAEAVGAALGLFTRAEFGALLDLALADSQFVGSVAVGVETCGGLEDAVGGALSRQGATSDQVSCAMAALDFDLRAMFATSVLLGRNPFDAMLDGSGMRIRQAVEGCGIESEASDVVRDARDTLLVGQNELGLEPTDLGVLQLYCVVVMHEGPIVEDMLSLGRGDKTASDVPRDFVIAEWQRIFDDCTGANLQNRVRADLTSRLGSGLHGTLGIAEGALQSCIQDRVLSPTSALESAAATFVASGSSPASLSGAVEVECIEPVEALFELPDGWGPIEEVCVRTEEIAAVFSGLGLPLPGEPLLPAHRATFFSLTAAERDAVRNAIEWCAGPEGESLVRETVAPLVDLSTSPLSATEIDCVVESMLGTRDALSHVAALVLGGDEELLIDEIPDEVLACADMSRFFVGEFVEAGLTVDEAECVAEALEGSQLYRDLVASELRGGEFRFRADAEVRGAIQACGVDPQVLDPSGTDDD